MQFAQFNPLDIPAAIVGSLMFGGHNYCWYDDGWSGPGYYWCGYGYYNGYGYGGGEGWHGWREHRHWEGQEHGHGGGDHHGDGGDHHHDDHHHDDANITTITVTTTNITTITRNLAEGSSAFQETSNPLSDALFMVRPPLKGGADWCVFQYDRVDLKTL